MNPHKTIYHSWIPDWLKTTLLFVAMFPHLMLMSLFHSNTTFTASFLDIEPEDIQFLLSVMYGSIVVTLLIFRRFFAYFRLRSYIILMCVLSIIILFLLSITKEYGFVIVLRVLEGVFGVLEGACFLPLIIGQLKTKHAKNITYLFLYAMMLTGGTLTSSLVKNAIMDYGWQEMFYIIIFGHLGVLLITLLLFNNNRLSKKYPLYQIDFTSCLFLLITLISGAYFLLYGRKLYWLESKYIILSGVIFLIFSGLFIIKQRLAKRPLFHFEVLKYKNVLIGVLLFFFFYIIRSGLNNVYSVMAKVWNWPWDYIVSIQYYNVFGTYLGVIIAGFLLIKEVSSRWIFFIGFALLCMSCGWFSFIFYPDTTINTIAPPLFLQGVAQGWLFTPMVMYLTNGIPESLSGNASLMGTTIRYWTTIIGFVLIQNLTYNYNQKHYQNLQRNFDSSNAFINETWNNLLLQFSSGHDDQIASILATGKINGMLSKQALLLSNMEIFTLLMWLSFFICMIIILINPAKIVLKKFNVKKPFFIG